MEISKVNKVILECDTVEGKKCDLEFLVENREEFCGINVEMNKTQSFAPTEIKFGFYTYSVSVKERD